MIHAMMMGESIDVQLYNQAPRGVQRHQIKDSDIVAWHIPKACLAWVRDHVDAAGGPGVYFLVNSVTGYDGHVPIYAGMTRSGVRRVMQHDKDFSHVLLFTGDTAGVFHDTSMAYIEGVFIDDIFEAAASGFRINVLNRVRTNGVTMSDADRGRYDDYASIIKWYIEYLGYDYRHDELATVMVTPSVPVMGYSGVQDCTDDTIVIQAPDDFCYRQPPKGSLYRLDRRGVPSVYGMLDDGVMMVLSGSTIQQSTTASVSQQVIALRESLVDLGFLSMVDDCYVFDINIGFKSARLAASVVSGAPVKGDVWSLVHG